VDGHIERGTVDAALAAGDDFGDHGAPSLKQKTVRKGPHGLLSRGFLLVLLFDHEMGPPVFGPGIFALPFGEGALFTIADGRQACGRYAEVY